MAFYSRDGFFCSCNIKDKCDGCNEKYFISTNADRIRSMSNEELAEVLINLPNYLGCNNPSDGCMMDFSENKLCSKCVLKWLRQECK